MLIPSEAVKRVRGTGLDKSPTALAVSVSSYHVSSACGTFPRNGMLKAEQMQEL